MRKLIAVCAVAVLSIAGSANAISYADGAIHNITSTIQDNVSVSDDPWGQGTTVNIVSPGQLENYIYQFGHSVTNLGMTSGDSPSHVASAFNMLAYNYSITNIGLWGNISFLQTYHNSHAEISGGCVSNISAHGDSSINITAMSNVNPIRYIKTYDNAQISISGGGVINEIQTYNSSVISLYGHDFKLDGVSIGYGPLSGSYNSGLTGYLNDGNQIQINSMYLYDSSSIVLVPEPATLLLLGLGGLFLKKKR